MKHFSFIEQAGNVASILARKSYLNGRYSHYYPYFAFCKIVDPVSLFEYELLSRELFIQDSRLEAHIY